MVLLLQCPSLKCESPQSQHKGHTQKIVLITDCMIYALVQILLNSMSFSDTHGGFALLPMPLEHPATLQHKIVSETLLWWQINPHESLCG